MPMLRRLTDCRGKPGNDNGAKALTDPPHKGEGKKGSGLEIIEERMVQTLWTYTSIPSASITAYCVKPLTGCQVFPV